MNSISKITFPSFFLPFFYQNLVQVSFGPKCLIETEVKEGQDPNIN
jgi:hypothetical protein